MGHKANSTRRATNHDIPAALFTEVLHLRGRARKGNWERGLRLWLMPFQREQGVGEREVMGSGERDAGCGFLRVGEGGSGWEER